MTNQPTVPGFIPEDQLIEREQEDARNPDDEPTEGLVIQDTEVIDATQIDPGTIATDQPRDPADQPQDPAGQGVPVEPIPPVSDPKDDPVVAAAEND